MEQEDYLDHNLPGSNNILNSFALTLRKASLQFEEKVGELSLLRRVGDIIGYVFDSEAFYCKFIDIIIEETNAENCSFMLMDAATERLVLKIARGRNDDGTFFENPVDSNITFSLGEGVAGYAALQRKTILINDVSQNEQFKKIETRSPIGSLLCTPLFFQEKLLGVINISHTQPQAFTQSNKRVTELLCVFVSSILGSAIEYIHLRDEEKFKTMFEGIRLPIVLIDPETNSIIDCNKYTEDWLGYSKEELVDRESIFAILPNEYQEQATQGINEIVKENSDGFHEILFLRKDGNVNIGEVNGSMVLYQGRNVIQLTIKDITAMKKTEKEIREARDFLENVIVNSRDGIVITDEKGNIISANTAVEKIYELDKQEMIGNHISMLTTTDGKFRGKTRQRIKELYEKGSIFFESTRKTKDGKIIDTESTLSMITDDRGNYIAGVSIIRDISSKKMMEEQLLQSEKLKSLGELAGGVAHDFNNVLAAILGRAQLLRMQIDTPPGAKEQRKATIALQKGLAVIEKAASDGAETVRRIQEFSRKRDDDLYITEVDLREVINDAIEFTRTRWKDEAESRGINITIQKKLSPVSSILGSASQLREVFTNLINNAVDAMPQGGNITIRSYKQNSQIIITIEDTGTGIPKAIRDRIFDPFFTTKGVQSTGLGMSVSYGIVQRHRGIITIDSVEEQGTTFTIQFPQSEKKDEEKREHLMATAQRKIKILVIEDEKEVRELLKDILIDGGHEVEISCDGREGLEMFRNKSFDLVFSDLGMPEISGWQVAEEIKKINSDIPVVLITGWEVQLNDAELRKSCIDLMVSKPFRVDQVLKSVTEGLRIKEERKQGMR